MAPLQLHPFCQQKEIVKYCTANNIIVQAYCPIIRGRMDDPIIQEVATKVRADHVLKFKHRPNYPLGTKYARDPAQILCRWSLQKGCVLRLELGV
jgi:diketogulonate reductase-like aldo/keto reductase